MWALIENDALVARCASEAETEQLGRAIAAVVTPGTVIGLVGPLGAGKTRLVRAIAEALGADPNEIGSPTFVLIHEYSCELPIYHFDTYRLRSIEEFDDLGVDEYLAGEGVCLVEWADRVSDRLPPRTWWVHAEIDGQCRIYRVRAEVTALCGIQKFMESQAKHLDRPG